MASQDEARSASEAIYENKPNPPFITDMDEAMHHYAKKAAEFNRGEETRSFTDLAQEVNPLSQRQMENMSEKEMNKYIEDTVQILRDKAVEENREISFTIVDKDGVPQKWTIKPASLSTDKENMFPDGDDGANFGRENMLTGKKTQSTQKDMTKSVQLSQELKRFFVRAALQAPGKALKSIKGVVEKLSGEAVRDALSNFGR